MAHTISIQRHFQLVAPHRSPEAATPSERVRVCQGLRPTKQAAAPAEEGRMHPFARGLRQTILQEVGRRTASQEVGRRTASTALNRMLKDPQTRFALDCEIALHHSDSHLATATHSLPFPENAAQAQVLWRREQQQNRSAWHLACDSEGTDDFGQRWVSLHFPRLSQIASAARLGTASPGPCPEASRRHPRLPPLFVASDWSGSERLRHLKLRCCWKAVG